MTGNEVRNTFLSYFEQNGHTVVKSSSLIPKSDPTLLFTNAGMVQFKDVYLGLEKRDYKRAASSQKCVRAGGKHNDLENVGVTARHHTFFEMLGNFSFGDYFKDKAIEFGWELITGVYKLPEKKLWVTVFRDDDEAFDLWNKNIGLPKSKIVRMGEEDNFWSMGDTGPCGPCSEILIDQGESFGCGKSTCAVGCECDRYLELWNLVFMQFSRDNNGSLTQLPNPSIDTGMGLERITAVIQGVKSNYETDLIREIISKFEDLTGKQYGKDSNVDISLRVVSDHIRALTFLISDGVLPSNEGRGYVLRRILRRAVGHLRKLEIADPALFKVSELLSKKMGDTYPEIIERLNFVTSVIKNEEERFFETIDRGLELLNLEIERHKGDKHIPGDVVFKLYDTFGFPVDLTEDIAKDSDLSVDLKGFNESMELQKSKSRKAWKGSGEEQLMPLYKEFSKGGLSTVFSGYKKLTDHGRITAIISSGRLVDNAAEGELVEVICDKTPFYGESGGQIGDRGLIVGENGQADVLDTQKPVTDLFVHSCKVKKGNLWVGDKVELRVNKKFRQGSKAHHTATHILQATLKEIIGDHIAQAGSYVGPERLRFDFSHFEPVDNKNIRKIEEIVNSRLRLDDSVKTETDVPYDEAIKSGATAKFEEKYGDKVRVVSIGDYSRELCGGTHLHDTGEAGLFKIITETSSSAGVRRIEALTGEACWNYLRGQEDKLAEVSEILKSPTSDLISRLKKLIDENEKFKKQLDEYRSKSISSQTQDLIKNAKEIDGVNVLSIEIPASSPDELRKVWDGLKSKNKALLAVLGSKSDGKAFLLVGVTNDIKNKYNAGKIIKEISEHIGGSGGGRPDMAQAGGTKPEKLNYALNEVYKIVSSN
jgi:alanyl-tRNA synthetase